MKIDKRRSEVPSLNHNFDDYTSPQNLVGHYTFPRAIVGNYIINSALGNEMDRAQYEPSGSTVYPYDSVKESPYQGDNRLYSAEFKTYRKSDLRISYGQSTDPFTNSPPLTIACWVYIPDVSTSVPDSDIYIFQKIKPGYAATDGNMEMSLRFVTTASDRKFVFEWYADTTTRISYGAGSPLNVTTVHSSEWKNPVLSGAAWVHVAVTITPKNASDLSEPYDNGDIVSNWVEIYVNGWKENWDPSGSTFGGTTTWSPQTDTNGDIIIGKAPGDDAALSGDQYWNNFNLNSISFWNSVLKSTEIRSLYRAANRFAGSGVVSILPRVYLNKLDNLPGSYPTIKRFGDSSRAGKNTPYFDDTNTRLFYKFGSWKDSGIDLAYDIFESWTANELTYRGGSETFTGSVKFFTRLTDQLYGSAGTYDLYVSESSFQNPSPHTGGFSSLSVRPDYELTLGPIFNNTGSNVFTEDFFSASMHNWLYTSASMTGTDNTDASSTRGIRTPIGLNYFRDPLSFVKLGEDLRNEYELGLDSYFGTQKVGGEGLRLEVEETGLNLGQNWYSKGLRNENMTIAAWVYASTGSTGQAKLGKMVICSKGKHAWQGTSVGGDDYDLYRSAIEYEFGLTGSNVSEGYDLYFRVGTGDGPQAGTNFGQTNKYYFHQAVTAGTYWNYAFSNGVLETQTSILESSGDRVALNQWNHVAVQFYAHELSEGMQFYINGKKVGVTKDESSGSGHWAVTIPTTESLYIGASYHWLPENDSTFYRNYFSGHINNLVMWNRIVSSKEIGALYHGASGNLALPDQSMTKQVSYPALVQLGGIVGTNSDQPLRVITGSFETPNKIPDITAAGTVTKNVLYDFQQYSASFDSTDAYTPFNESKFSMGDSDFYQHTASSVPGFNSKLKDKIQIAINITPNTEQAIYRNYSQHTTAWSHSEVPNVHRGGMYYLNHTNGFWEPIGDQNPTYITEASNPLSTFGIGDQTPWIVADSGTQRISYFTSSTPSQFMPFPSLLNGISPWYLGQFFSYLNVNDPVTYNAQYVSESRASYFNNLKDMTRQMFTPHSFNYAPFGTRYFATSSQTMLMSDYINSPMLLEKMEIDFGKIIANQDLGFGNDYQTSNPLSAYTFYIYRQTCNDMSTSPLSIDGGSSPPGQSAREMDRINSGSSRELIGWATAFFSNAWASASFYNVPIAAIENNKVWDASRTGIWQLPFSATSSAGAEFFHEWGVPSANLASVQNVQYTGSMKLQFSPKISGPALRTMLQWRAVPKSEMNNGRVFEATQRPSPATPSVAHQSYAFTWPGGASPYPFSSSHLINGRIYSTAGWHAQKPYSHWNDSGYLGERFSYSKAPPESATDSWGYSRRAPWSTRGSPQGWAVSGSTVVPDTIQKLTAPWERIKDPIEGSIYIQPASGGMTPYNWLSKVYKKPNRHYPATTEFLKGNKQVEYVDNGFGYKIEDIEVRNTSYILMPGDRLVLAVEKTQIPPTLPNYALGGVSKDYPVTGVLHYRPFVAPGLCSGSWLKISSDHESWLRLYGSQVKKGSQVYDSSPQQLTSNAIHECIQYDIPVVDQWEIDGESAYSGSIRTHFVTGAMTKRNPWFLPFGIGKTAYSSSVEWVSTGRDADGSTKWVDLDYTGENGINIKSPLKIGVSNRALAGDNSSKYYDNFAFQRNVTLVENAEIYYDSMLPKVSEIWAVDGFKAATWYSSLWVGGGLSTELNAVMRTADSTINAVGEWVWSRQYRYGWLMGHGTGSAACTGSAGGLGGSKYFLNWRNTHGFPKPKDHLPGNPGNQAGLGSTGAGPYLFFTLNSGSTGVGMASSSHSQQKVGNHVWPHSFPFESKYSGVERLYNQNFADLGGTREEIQDSLKAGEGTPWPTGSTFGAIIMSASFRPNYANVPFGGVGYVFDSDYEKHPDQNDWSGVVTVSKSRGNNSGSFPTTQRNVALSLFGIGDGNFLDIVHNNREKGSGARRISGTDDDYNSWEIIQKEITGSFARVAKPRGFKYGLINALPESPTMVFRGNRYGQFRDMLEQRMFTKYYNKKLGASLAFNWTIKSMFVEPTWADPTAGISTKNPSNTQSSNLSIFSTSSLPYFDGVVRNRDALPADGDVDVELE